MGRASRPGGFGLAEGKSLKGLNNIWFPFMKIVQAVLGGIDQGRQGDWGVLLSQSTQDKRVCLVKGL